MAKDKSKKIISTSKGDSSNKSSTNKIVDTSSSKGKKKKLTLRKKSKAATLDSALAGSARSSIANAVAQDLVFGRQTYLFIGASFLIIMLGMLLMMGGSMPDGTVWDESIIYSTRRTLIAPIVILIGLIVGVFAIFRD